MGRALRLFSAVFLLFLLLVATEMGPVMTEEKTCHSQIEGLCFSSTDCATVCQTEGFTDGYCHGLKVHRRCFCTKPCQSPVP